MLERLVLTRRSLLILGLVTALGSGTYAVTRLKESPVASSEKTPIDFINSFDSAYRILKTERSRNEEYGFKINDREYTLKNTHDRALTVKEKIDSGIMTTIYHLKPDNVEFENFSSQYATVFASLDNTAIGEAIKSFRQDFEKWQEAKR